MGSHMDWKQFLAYITGSVYWPCAAERWRAEDSGRAWEKLGRQALAEVTTIV
jgi:hypothetical protein